MLQHPQWFRLWSRSGQLELFVPCLKLAVAQMSWRLGRCLVLSFHRTQWRESDASPVAGSLTEASLVEEHWSWDCEQFPRTTNIRSYWTLGRWLLLVFGVQLAARLDMSLTLQPTDLAVGCLPQMMPCAPWATAPTVRRLTFLQGSPCMPLVAAMLLLCTTHLPVTSTATSTDCLYLWGACTLRAMQF